MKTEINVDDIERRARVLSEQLQQAVGELASRWSSEGRARLRRAAGWHEPRDLRTSFGIGVLLGVMLGAAVALLLSPSRGSEAREELGHRLRRAREAAGMRGADMREDGQPTEVLTAPIV